MLLARARKILLMCSPAEVSSNSVQTSLQSKLAAEAQN